jgi:hypothetical protein
MSNWKVLSLLQKVVLGLLIIVTAAVAPEMVLLLDFGGIELAFSFLLLYYKPLYIWLQSKFHWAYSQIKLVCVVFFNSGLFQPKVFTTHAAFCLVAMLVTGSLVLSVGLFLPAMLVNGMLV